MIFLACDECSNIFPLFYCFMLFRESTFIRIKYPSECVQPISKHRFSIIFAYKLLKLDESDNLTLIHPTIEFVLL
jgi:hypothetical protein